MPAPFVVHPEYYEHCLTERQREYLEAVESCGTQAEAAKSMGVNLRTLQRSVRAFTQPPERGGVLSGRALLRLADGHKSLAARSPR